MSSIGTKDANKAPGAKTPTSATSGPMMAASEYAGDVDASPITMELMNPMAPGLRVCSAGSCARVMIPPVLP